MLITSLMRDLVDRLRQIPHVYNLISLESGRKSMIRRGDESVIPSGDTTLLDGDRLRVIGRAEGISALRERYGRTRVITSGSSAVDTPLVSP